jgi:hypothetical protein
LLSRRQVDSPGVGALFTVSARLYIDSTCVSCEAAVRRRADRPLGVDGTYINAGSNGPFISAQTHVVRSDALVHAQNRGGWG